MNDLPDVGEATHFTKNEGGEWCKWPPGHTPIVGIIYSVKFSSGWIWDQAAGWRKPE